MRESLIRFASRFRQCTYECFMLARNVLVSASSWVSIRKNIRNTERDPSVFKSVAFIFFHGHQDTNITTFLQI